MRKHLAKMWEQQSNQENAHENEGKSIAIDSPEPVDEIRITPETNVNYNGQPYAHGHPHQMSRHSFSWSYEEAETIKKIPRRAVFKSALSACRANLNVREDQPST